jgi:uroporphyrinogen-III synthase
VIWRAAVTSDEGPAGRLHAALSRFNFEPVSCAVLIESAPDDESRLIDAAMGLDRYDWIVCASTRSVNALSRARGRAWPARARTAAVGRQTAAAIAAAGVERAPVTAETDGAEPLWRELKSKDEWSGRRVLVPTVPGGLRTLATYLSEAGAIVDEVEAYRMVPREARLIQDDWERARPDAVVIASPSAANGLCDAIGTAALGRLRAVVAIGPTTSAALTALEVTHNVSPRADADAVARHLAEVRDKFLL